MFKAVLITSALFLPLTIHAQNAKPFTFIQMSDTQLGMGGYEHDVKTFKQAVVQINAMKVDMVFMKNYQQKN